MSLVPVSYLPWSPYAEMGEEIGVVLVGYEKWIYILPRRTYSSTTHQFWLVSITDTPGFQRNSLSSFLAGWVIFHCNLGIKPDLPKWFILIPLPFFTDSFRKGNIRKTWLLKRRKLAEDLGVGAVKDLLFWKRTHRKRCAPFLPTESCYISMDGMLGAVAVT